MPKLKSKFKADKKKAVPKPSINEPKNMDIILDDYENIRVSDDSSAV